MTMHVHAQSYCKCTPDSQATKKEMHTHTHMHPPTHPPRRAYNQLVTKNTRTENIVSLSVSVYVYVAG